MNGLLQGKLREFDQLATLRCAFMGAQSNAGPVRTGYCIGPRIAVFNESTDEFMDKVWVRAAMPTTLNERQVVSVLDRLREHADRLR